MADNNATRVALPFYLQDLAIGFQAMGMIADRVSPRVPVNQIAGKYRVFGKNTMVPTKSERAPGTPPNAVDWAWSLDTFYITEYALRQRLMDEERTNNQSAMLGGIVDIEGKYTQSVTNRLAVSREQRIAKQFTTAANYPGANVITKAGGSEWDLLASANAKQPFIDITNLLSIVAQSAMVPKNMLSVVIPQQTFDLAIMNNDSFISRVQYNAITSITPAILGTLLGVKEVLLAMPLAAGTVEVAGADVVSGYPTSYLWGDTVWAGLIAEGQNDMLPTFARSLNYSALTGGQTRQTRKYRDADEGTRSDWIEVAEALDEKITYSAAGGIIVNTLSTI
jgi:hypothetical protein